MRGHCKLALLTLTLVVPTACTKVIVEAPAAPLGAQLSVERFLQAANQRDVRAMGNLFGTAEGPVMDTGGTFGCAFKKIGSWFGGSACTSKQDVEIRMDAIASILAHEDYRIVGEERVAGRVEQVRRVLVNMTTARGLDVNEVPFVVVQSGEGRWLVEAIDLQRVMAGR